MLELWGECSVQGSHEGARVGVPGVLAAQRALRWLPGAEGGGATEAFLQWGDGI